MSHDAYKPAAQAPKIPGLWAFFLFALVLLFLFWGVNTWLTRWNAGNAEPEEVLRAEFRTKTLSDLRAEESTKLDTYAWVDRAKGTVQIPINEAMKLVLEDINSAQPRAAYPVATPAPVAPTEPVAPVAPAPTGP